MEFATKIAFIAVGGAAGAVARHLVNISPLKDIPGGFPYPTFTVNVLGSFLIGVGFIVFADHIEISEGLRFGLLVGFLGAFTTFSTFELEIWSLVKAENYLLAFLYVLLSVVTGFIAFLFGVFLARKI
ncbi:MAG: fluoride efflux transporter CrcB [Acidobacteria bacterium]|nr:MAG: fluoride efflux transporter CrcB [Acidobacteriota bacterium]REJ98297.1 MAG: fluoride efflux transporter CrcB [Acidobacteriota bacterium]REK17041.1 MAG: fluoride efflux transporter CrcB [Acidobacteriota bacterium]REK42951.1 MAG: fluoride efflux transporter CrcB [Acidobacteriota bacterium]